MLRLRTVAALLACLLLAQVLSAAPAVAAPPAAPTDLTAVASHSFNTHLSWTDKSGGVARYVVKNGTVDSPTLPVGSTAYDWGGQSPLTHLCFTVRAVPPEGTSSAAEPACTTTPPAT